jgi:hypothetical protein
MDIRDQDRDDAEDEVSTRQPLTGVDLAQAPSVQLGMLLLLVLLALLVLWITWSLITG